jgi:hypothetical protein
MAIVAVAMLTGGLLLLQTLESALVSSTDSLRSGAHRTSHAP